MKKLNFAVAKKYKKIFAGLLTLGSIAKILFKVSNNID
jgi:hypothetical protein